MTDIVTPVIIGVDIGGTNTDVVLLCPNKERSEILAEMKELTTADVTTGVKKAILGCLKQAVQRGKSVLPLQVNIGTTHFVNAVVQGKDLAKVAAVRICGPVSEEVPPFMDFPSRLANVICGSVHLVHGGFRFDGKEHESLDEQQIRNVLKDIQSKGIKNIAFIGVFSPTRPEHEIRAKKITLEEYPEASVTLSHEIGHIGLLERENAALLNECLKPLCKKTISGFQTALDEIGVKCPFYLTQNDGTIVSSEAVLEQPVLTFASGPTNSMRGAAFLSELKDAIVVDIGGTTTDAGVLKNGFPREAASHVKVSGVRTNFRMPDVISIGLGGGSYVKEHTKKDGSGQYVTVGPLSAGLNLMKESYVFNTSNNYSDRFITATDVAVASGLCQLGSTENVKKLNKSLVNQAIDEIHRLVEDVIDKVKLSVDELPVIVVGGGSILIDRSRPLKGTKQLIIPEHFGVANAIGAALSKVSASYNNIVNLIDRVNTLEMEACVSKALEDVTNDPDGKESERASNQARKPFLLKARDDAMEEICQKIKATLVTDGATEESLEILEKEDSVLAYIPGNATQIKVKIVGDLSWGETKNKQAWLPPDNVEKLVLEDSQTIEKQKFSSTGQRIDSEEEEMIQDWTRSPKDPVIDPSTGEWFISEWDIECIVLGSGIYGCGGGGSPHLGRLRALKALQDGKKLRVVSPEKLLQNADPVKDIIISSSFIGAPLIMFEQAVSSHETTAAIECLIDLYEIGEFNDGNLLNKENVHVETSPGACKFIRNYRPRGERSTKYKFVAVMADEIGGMNAIEPFLQAANLDLPVLDCDGMSRAFPEVQMFIPYMFGYPPYPVAIVGSGNYQERTAMLYAPSNKLLENFLRQVSIENGCSAGMATPLLKDTVLTKSALHTVSSAWRLGNAILRARLQKESVIEAIVQQENGKHVMNGKILDVQRETSGGFNRGFLLVEGSDGWLGQTLIIEFQNENLVIIQLIDGKRGPCIGCVPDLICIVDVDTAEPITTEEVKFGLRVAVLLLPSHDLLRRPESLKWVGPQAFHYGDEIQFSPYKQRLHIETVGAIVQHK
uniref:Hydantoinase/oxoprolinase N-terminal domain-containing protein n=1 Tax=Biomphalaria glabrata TaxID=6526 RepID=A0A2C9JHJ5_BIOGL